MVRRHWQPVVTLLSVMLVAVAIYWSSFSVEAKDTESQVAAWELTVAQLYGKQLADFSPLGDDGLHFEWIGPEDSDLFCVESETCNIIRLANVISCRHGFRVSYEFLGRKDELLSKHLSSTVIVPVGHFKTLELDTEDLPDGGWIYLTGAKCQSVFPSI